MIFMMSEDKDKSEIRTDKYYIKHNVHFQQVEKPADLKASKWVRRYIKTLLTR